MRIYKTVAGERLFFKVFFIPNEKKARVSLPLINNNEYICDISDDYKHILLPKDVYFINGKNVEKLKLNKERMFTAKEYNENDSQ